MKGLKNITVAAAVMLVGLMSFGALNMSSVSAHGGDTTRIHSCVFPNQGPVRVLRIIGATETCRENETPLDWNTQGAAGQVGPR